MFKKDHIVLCFLLFGVVVGSWKCTVRNPPELAPNTPTGMNFPGSAFPATYNNSHGIFFVGLTIVTPIIFQMYQYVPGTQSWKESYNLAEVFSAGGGSSNNCGWLLKQQEGRAYIKPFCDAIDDITQVIQCDDVPSEHAILLVSSDPLQMYIMYTPSIIYAANWRTKTCVQLNPTGLSQAYHFRVILHQDVIFAFGVWDESRLGSLYSIDIKKQPLEWKLESPPISPRPRTRFSWVDMGEGQFLLFGGENYEGELLDVWTFNASSRTFKALLDFQGREDDCNLGLADALAAYDNRVLYVMSADYIGESVAVVSFFTLEKGDSNLRRFFNTPPNEVNTFVGTIQSNLDAYPKVDNQTAIFTLSGGLFESEFLFYLDFLGVGLPSEYTAQFKVIFVYRARFNITISAQYNMTNYDVFINAAVSQEYVTLESSLGKIGKYIYFNQLNRPYIILKVEGRGEVDNDKRLNVDEAEVNQLVISICEECTDPVIEPTQQPLLAIYIVLISVLPISAVIFGAILIALGIVNSKAKKKSIENELENMFKTDVLEQLPLVSDAVAEKSIDDGLMRGTALGGTTSVLFKKWNNSHSPDLLLIAKLTHPNIIQIYGKCDIKSESYLVLEYARYGSLLYYLKNDTDCPEYQLMSFALDIANGMTFLASKGLVHRDLRAKNIAVSQTLAAKVSNACMAQPKFKKPFKDEGAVNVRWASPEALKVGLFTTASDVWSFGITLYEIFTGGSLPYSDLSNSKVYDKVTKNGFTLSTATLPKEISEIAKKCCEVDPSKRPSFAEIALQLAELKKKNVPPSKIRMPQDEPTFVKVEKFSELSTVSKSLKVDAPITTSHESNNTKNLTEAEKENKSFYSLSPEPEVPEYLYQDDIEGITPASKINDDKQDTPQEKPHHIYLDSSDVDDLSNASFRGQSANPPNYTPMEVISEVEGE